MKIWILSADSQNFSSRSMNLAFSETFKSDPGQTEVLNPLFFSFQISPGNVDFFYNSQLISRPQIAILRLGWNNLESGLILAHALEIAGVMVINSSSSYRLASHKLHSLIELKKHSLPTPPSKFANLNMPSEEFLIPGETSLVFKQYWGSQGFGVTWSQDPTQSLSMIDFFRNSKTPFFSQKLIHESYGTDLRIFVCHGKILGSIERRNDKDLRSNIKQGGQAKPIEIDAEIATLAKTCVNKFGLFYAGIDLLMTTGGPLILEVNPSPGFEAISQALNKNIAADFAQEVANLMVP